MLLIPQASSHDTRKAHDHGSRLLGIDANERGDGVQGVEEKVWIDLTGERIETGLDEQVFLLFELHFIASIVPDLEWNGDAETGGGIGGKAERQRVVGACDCEQFRVKDGAQFLTKKFGSQHPQQEQQLKERAAEVEGLSDQAEKVGVGKGREAPDVLFVGSEVTEHAATQSDHRKEGKCKEFFSRGGDQERRDRDHHSGKPSADIPSRDAREKSALEREVEGGIGRGDNPDGHSGKKHNREPEGEAAALGESTLLAQQHTLAGFSPDAET